MLEQGHRSVDSAVRRGSSGETHGVAHPTDGTDPSPRSFDEYPQVAHVPLRVTAEPRLDPHPTSFGDR